MAVLSFMKQDQECFQTWFPVWKALDMQKAKKSTCWTFWTKEGTNDS